MIFHNVEQKTELQENQLAETFLDINLEYNLKQDSGNNSVNKMIHNKIISSETSPHKTQKTPRKRIRVRTRISEFADYTSTHGVGHVKRVNHPLHKIFWACCSLTALSYFGYQVYNLVCTYVMKDYNVLIDIKFDRQIAFPAVTFCNLNPMRKEHLYKEALNNPSLRDILIRLDLDVGDFNNSQTSSQTSTNSPVSGDNMPISTTTEETRSFSDDESFWDYMYNKDQDDLDHKTLSEELLARLGKDRLKELGHQLETMLLDCDFQGDICSPRNFTSLYNPFHGNCFTYNLNGESRNTSRPGPKYGLTLELYLEINQYVFDITEGAGAIITIHDQNEVPLPEQSGFLIAPGFETRLGIRKYEVERLGDPYYPCWTSDRDAPYNIFHHLFPNSYTYSICLLSCYQTNLIKSCGCGDAAYPLDSPYFGQTVNPCLSSNTTQLICQERVYDEYESGSISCDCEQSCRQIAYKGSASSVLWPVPTIEAQVNLINKYIEIGHPSIISLLNVVATAEKIDIVRNNVAKIHIYFEELNYERVYQKPAYTDVNLISDIGGNMGMFVGMSLLTLVEYGELLVYICYGFVCKCLGRTVQR